MTTTQIPRSFLAAGAEGKR